MDKKEFFDKIDNIRSLLIGINKQNDSIVESIALLDQLKDDANLLLDDEYDAGYNLGLDRGTEE